MRENASGQRSTFLVEPADGAKKQAELLAPKKKKKKKVDRSMTLQLSHALQAGRRAGRQKVAGNSGAVRDGAVPENAREESS